MEKFFFRKPLIIRGARQGGENLAYERVVPLEVKAEENLQSKSLQVYCQKFSPELAVRTSMSDYREEEWMTNLPLYAIGEIFTLI